MLPALARLVLPCLVLPTAAARADTGAPDTGSTEPGGGDTGATASVLLDVPLRIDEGDELVARASWTGDTPVERWAWDAVQHHGLDEGDFVWCQDDRATLSCTTKDDGELTVRVEAWGEDERLLGRAEALVVIDNVEPHFLDEDGAPLEGLWVVPAGEYLTLSYQVVDVPGDPVDVELRQGDEWCWSGGEGRLRELECLAWAEDVHFPVQLVGRDDEAGRGTATIYVSTTEGQLGDASDTGLSSVRSCAEDRDTNLCCSSNALILPLPFLLLVRRRRR